ncbi:MAG: transglutaminase family protein [Oscillatoriaceae cyanobacterium]
MSVKIALHHQTIYRYSEDVFLGPQVVRLRPTPHSQVTIHSYSLQVSPPDHSIYWRQDVAGNYMARLNFPYRTKFLQLDTDIIAEIKPLNAFSFLVEQYASNYPFTYEDILAPELEPFLQTEPAGKLLQEWLDNTDKSERYITDYILEVGRKVKEEITYSHRWEPGVQSCEETLEQKQGSCRDMAWLLVQIFRHLGLAARFVSGYAIQLADGEEAEDTADLHAWVEVYLPGAGWVGLDPTSGALTAEGYIPLACAASPERAAPVSGTTEPCESEISFSFSVTRLETVPKTSKPYSQEQWLAIDALGKAVDEELEAHQVGLTMGGEPTFVAVDDFDSPEWRVDALGPEKLRRSGMLLQRLRDRFAPGGWLHYGQGKWYPGEPLPRWALGCYWRRDGVPVWRNPELTATEEKDYGFESKDGADFIRTLAENLGVSPECIAKAWENDNPEPAAYVLPLLWNNKNPDYPWITCPLVLPKPRIELVPGDSPAGFRLPLNSITWADEEDIQWEPMLTSDEFSTPLGDIFAVAAARKPGSYSGVTAKNSIRVSLCVEVRHGKLYVFIPPIGWTRAYLDLVATIENTAAQLNHPVRLEGFLPPSDPRLQGFQITPDPGVVEVNIHPASDWQSLVDITKILYEEAAACDLGTEKYTLDGRTVSTGGGSHLTIGGVTTNDSPLLRRPDLLQSLITYWQHHPSLSYLFSGEFVGPTSQSPRVDEARHESLYELEIAFHQLENVENPPPPPWLIDRMLRDLLIDVTGNTHRAAFCIDKLYPVATPKTQLGLLEFRSFSMAPHPQMSLVLGLLVRTLVARFWQQPYRHNFIRWGTTLHDRFLLPHYIKADLQSVITDLQEAGYNFQLEWFEPFFAFRFPIYGEIVCDGVKLEIRHAIEPWHVLGEEALGIGTARYVDASMDRAQVRLSGSGLGRHTVTCNGYPLPLQPTGIAGEYVAGVRYRARKFAYQLHPAIAPHVPLQFDIVDVLTKRSIGGCSLYATDPTGTYWTTLPINSHEANSRMVSRFVPNTHTPGEIDITPLPVNPDYPLNLDLRRFVTS